MVKEKILRALDVLLSVKEIDQVIVVDDGSTDQTAAVARQTGATVLQLEKNVGKASAMRKGVQATDADIILFCDADVLGFKKEHALALLEPIIKGSVVMAEGIRDRWFGLPKLMDRLFPVMFAICGERAVRRFVFMDVPETYIDNMTDGIVMNYYCHVNKLPVAFIPLQGLDVIVKEKKYGLWKGLFYRFKMVLEFIKIRIIIGLHKKEFIKTYVQKNYIR